VHAGVGRTRSTLTARAVVFGNVGRTVVGGIVDKHWFETVKTRTMIALASDDVLFERLVLKGGNAIQFLRAKPMRQSLDLDYSLDGEFPDALPVMQMRLERLLDSAFQAINLEVFDVKLVEKPPPMRNDHLDFWHGYCLEFKVIEWATASRSVDDKRRRALSLGLGQQRAFRVDISRSEWCGEKKRSLLDGYSIYVYSERMIVCEKIRALCQQMPEYRRTVGGREGGPRAKDFFDIHYLVHETAMEFDEDFARCLANIFLAKRVPLNLIGQISMYRDFHRDDFATVRDTHVSSITLLEFDDYVDFLVDRLAPLQPFWNV
jgi:hypothetical protein